MSNCEYCGREKPEPPGSHWCSPGAKARLQADALYPEYMAPTVNRFNAQEIGLLAIGMATAGLVAIGERPQPRTMEVLTTHQATMQALTQKLVDIGAGMSPDVDDPVARSEAFDARGVRHKAFEDMAVLIAARATMQELVDYVAAEFDKTKAGA